MKKMLWLCVLGFQILAAQTYQITYTSSFEGKVSKNPNPTVLITSPNQSFILSQNILDHQEKVPFEITRVNNDKVTQFAFLKDHKAIQNVQDSVFLKQKFTLTNETKKILNYTVRKATTTVNSNAIEVWFTNDLKVKGGPSVLGADLGLVLQTVRNGSSVVTATSIKKLKQFDETTLFGNQNIAEKDAISYQDLVWKSRFITLPVFKDEIINFVGNPVSTDSIKRFANGTIILKKVKFPEITPGQTIFVQLKEQSNGDAYDRTGVVFAIPEEREKSFFTGLQKGADQFPIYNNGDGKDFKGIALTPGFLPAIELMRFFTPFGIGAFNKKANFKGRKWHDFVPYRQEITDLKPELSGKSVWIGTYIGNYDKGGHKVSLEITIHNSDQKVVTNNFALPLFTTTNIIEMAGQPYPTLFDSPKGLEVEFTLSKDLKNAQLRYITTGHGGWENGDEFLPKKNSLFLDDQNIFSFIPWRTDCGSYRLFNPVSGNFRDGLSSSDLSRSNWCPGTTTNPEYIDLGDLKAGTHHIKVLIPQGKPEGSSISYWNVSGVLLGRESN